MRFKLGSVALLEAAGSGYGLGLDDRGHLVEFMGDWPALAELHSALHGFDGNRLKAIEPVYWAGILMPDSGNVGSHNNFDPKTRCAA